MMGIDISNDLFVISEWFFFSGFEMSDHIFSSLKKQTLFIDVHTQGDKLSTQKWVLFVRLFRNRGTTTHTHTHTHTQVDNIGQVTEHFCRSKEMEWIDPCDHPEEGRNVMWYFRQMHVSLYVCTLFVCFVGTTKELWWLHLSSKGIIDLPNVTKTKTFAKTLLAGKVILQLWHQQVGIIFFYASKEITTEISDVSNCSTFLPREDILNKLFCSTKSLTMWIRSFFVGFMFHGWYCLIYVGSCTPKCLLLTCNMCHKDTALVVVLQVCYF